MEDTGDASTKGINWLTRGPNCRSQKIMRILEIASLRKFSSDKNNPFSTEAKKCDDQNRTISLVNTKTNHITCSK